ncbi:MAG: ATP-binding protein [Syntrophobacteraceae bacterium]
MKLDKFVHVENVVGAVALYTSLLKSGGLAVLAGRWGLGKTTLIEWLVANMPSFRAVALSIWETSRLTMVEDLLRCYRVEARGRLKHDFRELVKIARKHGLPLFIDEADRVVRRSMLIETVRDLHDLAQIPIILVGSENLISLLQRHDMGPVFSRVTEVYEFKELSAGDVQRISLELCDLKCSDKVAAFVRTVTLGDFRLLKAFLIKTEEICSFRKISEITMQIAEDASSVVAFREELMTVRTKKSGPSREAPPQLQAAANG